jgi:hypothetical protein
VDLLYFVRLRLQFAEHFYESCAPVFIERIRKIEAGEEPYIDHRDPEYADEPAFLAEWMEAEASLEFVGVSALGFIEAVLHEYLKERTSNAAAGLVAQHRRNDGWFHQYRRFFDAAGLDWKRSGADLDFLEQAVLTRNDFTHNPGLLSYCTYQTEHHAKKHPATAFRHPDFALESRLTVTKDMLYKVTANVGQLVGHIEQAYP